jgi:hypothetical protein
MLKESLKLSVKLLEVSASAGAAAVCLDAGCFCVWRYYTDVN